MTTEKTPTQFDVFLVLVEEKKRRIHKASLQDAYFAAEEEFVQLHGFRPDFGWSGFEKRYYRQGRKCN